MHAYGMSIRLKKVDLNPCIRNWERKCNVLLKKCNKVNYDVLFYSEQIYYRYFIIKEIQEKTCIQLSIVLFTVSSLCPHCF